jgi:hypothetical protein
MRRRPAPSAARTAISWPRVLARESRRLATFAQATQRVKNAAPINISSIGPHLPRHLLEPRPDVARVVEQVRVWMFDREVACDCIQLGVCLLRRDTGIETAEDAEEV